MRMLDGCTDRTMAGMLTNHIDSAVEFLRLSRGQRCGDRISLLFNPHRLSTVVGGAQSMVERLAGSDESSRLSACLGLARVIIWKEDKVSDVLWYALHRGVNGSGVAYEFSPFIARSFYQRSSPSGDRLRILDPCAGWGGRMIGAASLLSCVHYQAFEPSSRTHAGLNGLVDWLKALSPSFEAQVECGCFEDSRLESASFDCAVTSPPYFDTETYADEPTQSAIRYNSFASWLEGFYEPMVVKTMDALRPGAPFILNVGDRKYPLSSELQRICQRHGFTLTKAKDYMAGSRSGDDDGKGEQFWLLRTA